ncbi:carbohydrate ABC transporter membrane protein 1 (CUT1 family) [Blastococcus colisei]|uniref:Carbohydrate ABC transporter membrane protein 1 (CUT1 family) n=1 Tax=Blastococcus colisei TaxID=1564162 RepID=A0A543PA10_9ACTN|nr:ABC transporter permease subunit [Blastococcus colisei]TQN40923.1 carbohydrate ABC transporter membrane protein 1 (CUT1 family) [Blastococcus colisei]
MTTTRDAEPSAPTSPSGKAGAARRRPGPRTRAALLVLPALVPVVAVVGAALTSAVLLSLGLTPLVGEPSLSLDAYRAVATDLGSSLRTSLGIAAASTAIAAAVGLCLALAATAAVRRSRLLGTLAALTIPIPHLVGAAAMGLLLADAGFLSRLVGVDPSSWPPLVGGRLWVAVVAEYAWKESAFVALVVAGVLSSRAASYAETAALLGAGRWARLRHVTLPLAAPALGATAAVSFVYTLGSYEVAALLGRAYPEPLAVLAFRLFTSIDLAARPQAAAVAVTTALLALAVVLLALRALRRLAAEQ